MLQEINRIKIIRKANELGIRRINEVTTAKNSERILSLPDDYPKKSYPSGWAKKVIENDLFEFQKELSENAITVLNMYLPGKADTHKVNRTILNMVSCRYLSAGRFTIDGYDLEGDYAKKVMAMIINGEDDNKILDHARILSYKGCVPKEYKNHEFIAGQLKSNEFDNTVRAIDIMDSYTETEIEIVLMLASSCSYIVSFNRFTRPVDSLNLIMEMETKFPDGQWKKMLARNWLGSGSHDELVQFFKYYDAGKVDCTDEESYANVLSNYKFEGINMLAPLMRYVVTHKKYGFLKKIASLQRAERGYIYYSSFLNDPKLWTVLNLNELSENDIESLADMPSTIDNALEEIYALCMECNITLTPKEFFFFIENSRHGNAWKNQIYTRLGLFGDEAMIRVRELPDRKMVSEEDITAITYALREKRFSAWRKTFGTIKNISKADVLEIILNRSYLEDVLMEIKTTEDLDFVLRNRDLTGSLKKRRSDYLSTSENKQFLSMLDVSEADAASFVTSNCFDIAKTYYYNGRSAQKENVIKIAKAAILGKLDILKYADLEKEIALFITNDTKEAWKKNTSLKYSKYMVGEYIDFKSTMILGEYPVHTCQSYKDGSYNECLLSNFDANKKIVYVSKDGELLGRAILRLTKASNEEVNSHLSFMDVTKSEDAKKEDVELCIFLEKPYVKKGVSAEENVAIKKALQKLATVKAREMNISLYCNDQYEGVKMNKYIYISRSKNGSQYLDSLCGSCGTRDENCFHIAWVCV